jgi:hypothetical protein
MKIKWPDGKSFAFTVFDDPDRDRLYNTRPVYEFLLDLGFRTTKGVWMLAAENKEGPTGLSCDDKQYRDWIVALRKTGFEIGHHNARSHNSMRELTLKSLDNYKNLFGHDVSCMSNHYMNREAIYWGEDRLSGFLRQVYRIVNQRRVKCQGHVSESDYFWGDLCADRIRYVRNFVYPEINTLKVCPMMPYHDPHMPYVRYWYASCEGGTLENYVSVLSEANQDRLVEEGGACIMYTHYGMGFFKDGMLDKRFRALMKRLAGLNGWFVPVSELLDFLKEQGMGRAITDKERNRLQRKWMMNKLIKGSS